MTLVAAVSTLSTKRIPIMSIWKRQVIHRYAAVLYVVELKLTGLP